MKRELNKMNRLNFEESGLNKYIEMHKREKKLLYVCLRMTPDDVKEYMEHTVKQFMKVEHINRDEAERSLLQKVIILGSNVMKDLLHLAQVMQRGIKIDEEHAKMTKHYCDEEDTDYE